MFSIDQYELLDFGGGRKLERFGPHILDRPSPAAGDVAPLLPSLWRRATARYERFDAEAGQSADSERGAWLTAGKNDRDRSDPDLPASWEIHHAPLVFELRLTPFGHLGVFPEQATNWDWLRHAILKAGRPLEVLNLFAYTGGSTMACAAAGARVVHVDSARNIVQWARQNARHSGLEDAPIRWIVEDAALFVRRELKRGRSYDAIILDPPSYGHGPSGQSWRIDRDLPALLSDCADLTRGASALGLITCHSAAWGKSEMRSALIASGVCSASSPIHSEELHLKCGDSRRLHSGVALRWQKSPDN
jgi:23S rRNA (cytosine1962-C5)-methyltransferase